ncbi:MAG: hypothetical protein H0V09_06475 [Gemmatimonadetes bacterium]|nr:hypothetical protein [Gemmatimonadota bacterium]
MSLGMIQLLLAVLSIALHAPGDAEGPVATRLFAASHRHDFQLVAGERAVVPLAEHCSGCLLERNPARPTRAIASLPTPDVLASLVFAGGVPPPRSATRSPASRAPPLS